MQAEQAKETKKKKKKGEEGRLSGGPPSWRRGGSRRLSLSSEEKRERGTVETFLPLFSLLLLLLSLLLSLMSRDALSRLYVIDASLLRERRRLSLLYTAGPSLLQLSRLLAQKDLLFSRERQQKSWKSYRAMKTLSNDAYGFHCVLSLHYAQSQAPIAPFSLSSRQV